MAQKYFGFGKYTHQQTKTFIVGDKMGNTEITSLPTAELLAGVPIHNNAGTVEAMDDFTDGFEGGYEYLLAEDFPADGDRIVCYEIISRDIDSLVERPTPRKVKDLDGNPLFI